MTGSHGASVIVILSRVAIFKEFPKCLLLLWPRVRGSGRWGGSTSGPIGRHFSVLRKWLSVTELPFYSKAPMETFMWGSLLCRCFPRIRQFCNVLPLIPALWPWQSYLMSLVLVFLIKQKSCVAYLTDSCKDQMGQCCESSLAWCLPHTVNSIFLALENYRLNYFRIQEKEKMYLYRAR